MAEVVESFRNLYSWAEKNADDRVANWFLVRNPIPVLCIVAIYLVFVCFVGPKFMENRKPYDFGIILCVYNFALVALNYYIVMELMSAGKATEHNYVCTPVRHDSYDPDDMRIASALWWYFFSKLIELADTVFFVLRKKSRQITLLHVYHHSSVILLRWVSVKWVPGGQSVFSALLNAGTHVLMYTYYGLAALGPRMKQYLWWKKYITMLQLGQFCLIIVHSLQSIHYGCDFPAWLDWTMATYVFSFVILFTNFYIQTYIRKGRQKKVTGSEGTQNESKKKN